ncbi:MAG: helix-turn-helix domain-containing protein [Gemmatimonadota bacterium]|nr:helix-turn-helix domain-containing protein [Gemmatimonadota bacterium]
MAAFDEKAFADRIGFAFGLATTRHRLETQGDLAGLLSEKSWIGIKASALSRWLSGSRPSFEHLVTLAELANVDPGWLAMGSLSEAPEPEDYLPLREPELHRVAESTTGYESETEPPRALPRTPVRRASATEVTTKKKRKGV